jgi:probable phosphoglycerate mutase
MQRLAAGRAQGALRVDNPLMTDFVFIRHGETDWNRQQRFQGQIDVPLNDTGHAQAQRLSERLADEPAQVLLASDLLRTRQTGEPLSRRWGLAATLNPAFREQSFGVLEGLDVPTIQARHPELWASWLEHRADFALPGGGESIRQFHARVLGAVRETAEAWANRVVTVVTHGGVLDMLWRTANGLPLDGLRACEIPNTGINRLRWRAGTLEIVQWADAGHLAGLPPQPSTAAGER